jgi:hypothetical protein
MEPQSVQLLAKLYSRLLYTLSTAFVRLSIIMFLLKMVTTERICKIIIYTTAVIIIGSTTFYFFLALFQCYPISFFWDRKTLTYYGLSN